MKDMMKSLRLAFANMCGVMALVAICALGTLLCGCSVTKVEYEKNDKGEVSYRIYRNDHWLKTESTGIRGGMTDGGKFEFNAEGMKSSPSEEFNRTMQTYTTAFVQLAQIAAAAYNPSSTGVKVSETASAPQQTAAETSAASPASATVEPTEKGLAADAPASATANAASTASTTNATDCVDCAVPAK